MTFREACSRLVAIHADILRERRIEIVKRLDRCELELKKLRPLRRPTGPVALFLRADYRRLAAYLTQMARRREVIFEELRKFDARRNPSTTPSLEAPEIAQRLRALGTKGADILGAIAAEKERRKEWRQLHDALDDLKRVTGSEHKLVQPGTRGFAENCGKKQEATLVDRVDLRGRSYARATADRGRSFLLYPWLNKMDSYKNRSCWFWYDATGRFFFAPLTVSRPPLMPKAADASACTEVVELPNDLLQTNEGTGVS